jgi:hypothetical protein
LLFLLKYLKLEFKKMCPETFLAEIKLREIDPWLKRLLTGTKFPDRYRVDMACAARKEARSRSAPTTVKALVR